MRLINLLSCTVIGLGAIDFICYTVSGEVFGESSVYTLSAGLEGFDLANAKGLVFTALFFAFVCLTVAITAHRIPSVRRLKGHGLLACYIILLALVLSSGVSRYAGKLLLNLNRDQDRFRALYRVPPYEDITLDGKRNLVYLYLESMESAFFDEAVFPGLVPNLKRLGSQAHNFSEIADAGDFTMGALVASQCGIRLITPIGAENMMDRVGAYLPAAKCLGDWLKASGYKLEYIGGAAKEFAGKNNFLESHGFTSVKGSREGARKGEPRAPWGRFDDVVLDDVFQRYTELTDEGGPFALFTLTVDTHAPGGAKSPLCGDLIYGDGTNSMLNSVHCSDRIVGEFISKLLALPSFEHTLLAVGTDHVMHKSTADNFLSSFKQRKLFLLIFDGKNTHSGAVISKPGSSLDIGATILSYLTNGRLTELGLGRSLQDQNSKTLLSEHSDLESFSDQLDEWRSSFLQFWRFPDEKIVGFNVSAQGIANVHGSLFRTPVAFELDSETGSRITSILLPDDAQSELQRSNKSALLIKKCPPIHASGRGELYCYMYRKHGQQFTSGSIAPDNFFSLEDLGSEA